MKKIIIGFLIFFGIVITLWIVARLTGALQLYKVSTPSNEPALKVNEHVLVSNLKSYSRGNFIAYTSSYMDSLNATYMENYKPGGHFLYRLCAVPGDQIEMKNGILFVNGKNFDEELNLKNQFKITVKEFEDLIEDIDKLNDTGGDFRPFKDSMLVAFDNQMLKKYSVKIKLMPFIMTDTSDAVFKWHDKNSTWTADNFGPLSIPAGCYFGLGDNRHNSLDSRYTGFIKKDNIKGVVLNK